MLVIDEQKMQTLVASFYFFFFFCPPELSMTNGCSADETSVQYITSKATHAVNHLDISVLQTFCAMFFFFSFFVLRREAGNQNE